MRRRQLSRLEPATALLLVERDIVMVGRRLLAARPNPCSRDAKQRFVIGVHSYDGMNEKAPYFVVTGRTKTESWTTVPIEIDLRRILHRHHPAAIACCSCSRDVGRQQRGRIDIIRRQKTMRRHLA